MERLKQLITEQRYVEAKQYILDNREEIEGIADTLMGMIDELQHKKTNPAEWKWDTVMDDRTRLQRLNEFQKWLDETEINIPGCGEINPTDIMIQLMRKAWDAASNKNSKDNEIKMQMAAQMYCALLNGTRVVDGIDEIKVIESFCEASEQIFNRFNK